jgi:amidase
MAFAEYESLDAVALAELVKRGEVTPAELVEEAIVRVERWDPRLNFVVTRLDRLARDIARGPLTGPLAGVPYLLKDLVAAYKGVPLRNGSHLFQDFIPDHDSELVARHRRAGLVCVAKSSTPEFGLTPFTEPPIHPPTETPWRAGHTSGGSSGGSAAGVAARVVPIGHASDGGGSIRIPASCCGLFGLKPSRGRTPTGPDASENWYGFAIEHAVTRSVRDSAAVLDATCDREASALFVAPTPERPFLEETRRAPRRLRIGFTSRPFLPGTVSAECVRAVEDAARLCASLGHEVEEATLSIDGQTFARDFVTHVAASTASELIASEALIGRPARRQDVHTETWLIAMLGQTFSAVDLTLARRRLFAAARRALAFHERYDLLLTPTLGRPPVRHGELRPPRAEALAQELIARADLRSVMKIPGLIDMMAARVFTFMPFTPVANVTGQPSMSVPLYWDSSGLPIGTMFTAPLGDEATLFQLAAQLEAARPWEPRRPG